LAECVGGGKNPQKHGCRKRAEVRGKITKPPTTSVCRGQRSLDSGKGPRWGTPEKNGSVYENRKKRTQSGNA